MFNDSMALNQQLGCLLEKSPLPLTGKVQVEHRNKDGDLIGVYDINNGIVDVGMVALLDSFFRNQTQPAAWYIGIIDNSGYTALANADTMSSHAGWNEFTTYSQGTRPAWTTVAAASRAISNTTTTDFSITGSGTLKGIFITSNSTKAGTTGTLWSTATFASNVAVSNGDTLKITYTVNG